MKNYRYKCQNNTCMGRFTFNLPVSLNCPTCGSHLIFEGEDEIVTIKEFIEDEIINDHLVLIQKCLLKYIDGNLNRLARAYTGQTTAFDLGLSDEGVDKLFSTFISFRKIINVELDKFKQLTTKDILPHKNKIDDISRHKTSNTVGEYINNIVATYKEQV